MLLAPIVVFSYNRPYHLNQTLRALSENELASESDLFVFCDGAKANITEQQANSILENRKVAKGATGFKSLTVFERDNNLGLARSIIEGVTTIINEYGKVIVLEDDLITSPYFLKYMNSALDYYADRPGVMSISANRPPLERMAIPLDYEYDVFVCLRSFSTGWGTWKNRWDKVDWSLRYLDEFLKHPAQIRAFNRGGEDMTEMLTDQKEGKIDSWAIRFGYAHFKEHCVAILPCIPYVDNIGFDGTGRHSGVTNDYRNDLSLSVKDPVFVDVLYEDSRIINAFYNSYCRIRRPFWQRGCNYIARKLGKKPPFVIKRRVYECKEQ